MKEKEYTRALRVMQQEIEKLNPEQAELFKGFIDDEIANHSKKTIVIQCYYFAQMFADVDPLNRDEKYILKAILTHSKRASAWRFYRYLYTNNLLDENYRFLQYQANFNLVKELIDRNLSVRNIVCYSNGQYIYRKIVSTQNYNAIRFIQNCINEIGGNAHYATVFADYITSFFGKHNITSFEELNDILIEECILNAPNYKAARDCRYFLAYGVSKIHNNNQLKMYPVSVLSRPQFAKELINGYRTVIYNAMDKVPEHDKWIILPNGEENRSTQITAESTILIDFTEVQNEYFRKLLKEWFWSSTKSIVTLVGETHVIRDFLNMYFPDVENVREKFPEIDSSLITNVCNHNDTLSITQTMCAQYKAFVCSGWNKTESRNWRIYPVLSFVRFIDNYASSVKVDKECYLYLTNRGTLNRNGPIGVSKEDLEQIAGYINDHKNDDHNSLCFYVMFHIALNTEFRISQIATLPYDCVKESMKVNEYVIRSTMKQSGYETIEQPCARVVKDIILAYQRATEEYRAKLPLSLRKYLFVHEDYSGNFKTPLKANSFSRYLKDVCEKLGLPSYTAKNLRITYITNAKEYAMRNNLSDLTLLKVTNHANMDTVNNHYIQEKIIDALQATIGVIIGDVNIDGTISAKSDNFNTSKDVVVANGLGFCQSTQCTNQGPLPCQRCKHFFTTIENIPYYRQEIKRLQAINDGNLSPYDAEDVNNLIRLNTYILDELIILKKKGDEENGIIC